MKGSIDKIPMQMANSSFYQNIEKLLMHTPHCKLLPMVTRRKHQEIIDAYASFKLLPTI